MTAILQVHQIGCAGDPTATTRTEHADATAALSALHGMFPHKDTIRGDERSGTVGCMTGNVFQASRVWSIREVK